MTVSDHGSGRERPLKRTQKSKGLKWFMRLAGGLWKWALRGSRVGISAPAGGFRATRRRALESTTDTSKIAKRSGVV